MHSSRRGSRDIEHIGSAHDETELEVLKAAARQRLIAGQDELDLAWSARSPPGGVRGGPLPITSSRIGHLQDAHDELGFSQAAGGDEVFRQLVLARIIEPASKLDSPRVLCSRKIRPPRASTPFTDTGYAAQTGATVVWALCGHGHRRPASPPREVPGPIGGVDAACPARE